VKINSNNRDRSYITLIYDHKGCVSEYLNKIVEELNNNYSLLEITMNIYC